MKNVRILLATMLVAGAIVTPVAAQAQWRNHGRAWARPVRVSGIRGFIDVAERESNSFRANFERLYDRRDLDRYRSASQAKRSIQELDESFERLRAEVDDRNPRRGRDEAAAMLREAQDVQNLFERNRGFHTTVAGGWQRLRLAINDIARFYDLPTLR